MGDTQVKLCKMCCKEIPAAARKCPYCQHFQNKLTVAAYSPFFSLAYAFFITGIVAAVVYVVFGGMFRGGESFTPYAGQVVVTDSRLVFEDWQSGPYVSVVGHVKNSSPVTWKDVSFAVDFYDAEGRVIDTKQDWQLSYRIPADDEVGFRVSFPRKLPETDYGDYSVRVVWAKDDSAAF